MSETKASDFIRAAEKSRDGSRSYLTEFWQTRAEHRGDGSSAMGFAAEAQYMALEHIISALQNIDNRMKAIGGASDIVSEDTWEVVDTSWEHDDRTHGRYELARNGRIVAEWSESSSGRIWTVYDAHSQARLADFTSREHAEKYAREWAANHGKQREHNATAYRVRNDGEQTITVELPAVEIEGLVVNPKPCSVTLTPGAFVEVQLPHTITISEV